MLIFDDRDFEFDSERTSPDFGPMTDLRATFELRTGVLTTAERLNREWKEGVGAFHVPTALAAVVAERSSIAVNSLPADDVSFFCVNGRWSFPRSKFELTTGQAVVEQPSGAVVAAELTRSQTESFFVNGRLPDDVEQLNHEGQLLVRRPWEIMGLFSHTLMTDLLMLPALQFIAENDGDIAIPPPGVTVVGEEPYSIHPRARVYPTAVLNCEDGPIVIDEGAVVRPGAILVGPVYVGRDSTILEQSLIKANTSIGPRCKVAGEVGGTIFQGFANKAHDGHLGDSYVGEWVNLGAGTTNSNLLNTYGEIYAQLSPASRKEKTGLQYFGAIIGDHAKFAIQSRIMTGTIVGTGAMIALSKAPPASVMPFAWMTDTAIHPYRWNKFLQVAETVMQRRQIAMSDAMRDRLKMLHEHAMESTSAD